jgi:hypothetical protein
MAGVISFLMLTNRRKGIDSADAITAEKIMAAAASGKMQAAVAFMRIAHDPSTSKHFLQAIESDMRVRLDFCTAALRKPRKVTFSLAYDSCIYAEVSSFGAGDFEVTINVGLVIACLFGGLALVDETTGCLSSMAITEERRAYNNFKGCEDTWLPLIDAYRESPFSHILPKEPWRIILAHSIACRSLDFVLYHEVHHILAGHLEFIRRWENAGTLSEGSSDRGGVPFEISQLMESQADDGATRRISRRWRILTEQHDFSEGPLLLGPFGFTFFETSDIFRALIYSMCLIFVIMEEATAETDELARITGKELLEKQKYPSVDYRLWRALQLSGIDKEAGLSWSKALDDVRQCLVAKKLVRRDTVLTTDTSDKRLREYEKLLAARGGELLPFERQLAVAVSKKRPALRFS